MKAIRINGVTIYIEHIQAVERLGRGSSRIHLTRLSFDVDMPRKDVETLIYEAWVGV